MANVLVRWAPGPVGSDRNKGDIVDIREDSTPFGDLEVYPDYLRVSITGLDATNPRVQEWTRPEFDPAGPFDEDTGESYGILHRKSVGLLWADLPQAAKDDILVAYADSLVYTTTKVKVKNFLVRKYGQSTPPGLD